MPDVTTKRKQGADTQRRKRLWLKEGQRCGKTVLTVHDLQNATGTKLLDRLTKVINGEKGLVRVR